MGEAVITDDTDCHCGAAVDIRYWGQTTDSASYLLHRCTENHCTILDIGHKSSGSV